MMVCWKKKKSLNSTPPAEHVSSACVCVCVNAEEVLPVRPQKDWLHMDKLEPEKLEWMRDLPSPRKKGTKKVD